MIKRPGSKKTGKTIYIEIRPGTSIKVPYLGMSVKSPGIHGKPQNTATQWWGITQHRGSNLCTIGAGVV